jgi:hypothetical protein
VIFDQVGLARHDEQRHGDIVANLVVPAHSLDAAFIAVGALKRAVHD